MRVQKLKISNLRNISQAELDFSPNINYIQGDNGAGKTTVIEALYLLARSRSFKRGHQKSLIQHNQNSLTIFGKAYKNEDQHLQIGIQKDATKTLVKMNGQVINRLSDLAKQLPIALITPQSQKILEEGPEYRRRLLNWGVFHVEPNFGHLMATYNRTLQQRNQALKDSNSKISIWDDLLTDSATQINILQRRFLEKLEGTLHSLIDKTKRLKGISVSFNQGWDSEISLKEALSKKMVLDKRRLFTSVGPHRADIVFETAGKPIREKLSRGQQKYLLILTMLAQAQQMEVLNAGAPVFLIDDFQSELDQRAQSDILDLFTQRNIQTVITGISDLSFLKERPHCDKQMFHVEQGVVKAV